VQAEGFSRREVSERRLKATCAALEPSLASVVHDWPDFYGLVGTASATLVGLVFVAPSVGASVFNESQREPMKAHLTPTVAHFLLGAFICILILIPTRTWRSLSIVLGCLGVAGAMPCGSGFSGRSIPGSTSPIACFISSIPTLGNLLVVIYAVMLFVAVECRDDGHRPYYFAASRDQKCLRYDGTGHCAFPKPAVICVVDAQRTATDYGGLTRGRPCVAASDF
jgi:hypothetical protein